MKRLNILLFISVLAVGLFSCDKEEYADASYDYVGVVANLVSGTVPEGTVGSSELVVPIQYLAPGAGEMSITFTVTGTAKLGTDFTVPSAVSATDNTFTVSLPGSTSATPERYEFSILTVPNYDQSEIDNLIIEAGISAISNEGIFTSYPVPASFSSTILDDDCTYDASVWAGTYSCNEPGYGNYEITLTQDADDPNKFWNNNFWDYGGTPYYVFDPNSFDVTIPSQTINMGGDDYDIEGSGEYSQCSNSFFTDYLLDGGSTESNRHTFTKVE